MNSLYQSSSEQWREKQRHFLDLAPEDRERQIHSNAYYYGYIRKLLTFIVEKGKRVLCLRSDIGQYLDWVQPSRGLGIEISPRLVEIARSRCPQYEFRHAYFEDLDLNETFDYVLITNGINNVFGVQETFSRMRRVCGPHTRLVILFHNFLWQPLVVLAEKCRLKIREPSQNWLSLQDVTNMLVLEDFEVVREYRSVLAPKYVPLLSSLLNEVVAKLPLLNRLCLVQALVARPKVQSEVPLAHKSVSVVIPCKNEKGTIEDIVLRTPEMGSHMELIFCDDASTDGTGDEVRRLQTLHSGKDIKLVCGPGISKAENVWTGLDEAQGDVVMILDGDLAVPPEELPKFYDALVSGKAEFINGPRMVYPMRDQAMRLLNVAGNKMFSLVFSFILRQNIKDTLCGTKVFWNRDYQRIRSLRGWGGIRDRWGDYELIFGAAKLNLKLIDLPIHYMERTYGLTKMTNRLGNAWIMFRMCLAAFRKFR